MLTDIEIAQQCAMKPITEVAGALGIRPEELEPVSYTHLTLPTICSV